MSELTVMKRIAGYTAVVLLISTLSGCGINNIPTYKQQVIAAWSQVLNEYQRRTDLIPNLVATVKGYAAHEANVLEAVTDARAKVSQTRIPADILTNPKAFHEFEQNQATLGGALSRLMMVTENYPNLKADQNFLVLQAQLEGTENRIAVARRDYIIAVQQYDTELTTIPGRWYHAMFYSSYQPVQNFTISEQAQQTPKVNFSGTP
ncbi:MAG: LemA family protein [Gammaproteobacteria bacterium]|nr:LemA family protein [Gammaproteobacteria bacterium]MDE2346358.1 LemA family protein [Gammaproteobacteria bacterium]